MDERALLDGAADQDAVGHHHAPVHIKIFLAINAFLRIFVIFMSAIGPKKVSESVKSFNENHLELFGYFLLMSCVSLNMFFTWKEGCHHYSPHKKESPKIFTAKTLSTVVVASPFAFFGYNLVTEKLYNSSVLTYVIKSILATSSFLLALPLPYYITSQHLKMLIKPGEFQHEMKHILGQDTEPDINSNMIIWFTGIAVIFATAPDEITVSEAIPYPPVQIVYSIIASSLECLPHLSHFRYHKLAFRIFRELDCKQKLKVVASSVGHGIDGFSGLCITALYAINKNIWSSWIIVAALTEMIVVFPEMVFHSKDHHDEGHQHNHDEGHQHNHDEGHQHNHDEGHQHNHDDQHHLISHAKHVP